MGGLRKYMNIDMKSQTEEKTSVKKLKWNEEKEWKEDEKKE